MSRDLICQLYLQTAIWLWPVLWLQVRAMQRHLATLPDTDDPQHLYEIRVTRWGGLQLIKLTHGFTPRPLNASCALAPLIPAVFETEDSFTVLERANSYVPGDSRDLRLSLPTWQGHIPNNPSPQPAPPMRHMGRFAAKLDPG